MRAGIVAEEEHRRLADQAGGLAATAFRTLEAELVTSRRAIAIVQSDLATEESDLQSAQVGEQTIMANIVVTPGADPMLICLYIAAADSPPNGLIFVNEAPASTVGADVTLVRSAVAALEVAGSSTETATTTLATFQSRLAAAEVLAAPYVPSGEPTTTNVTALKTSAVSVQSDALALSVAADGHASQLAVTAQGILDSEMTAVNEVERACIP